MFRILASLGALILLAGPPALAQDVDQDMSQDEGGGGCVYNRQVHSQGAEVCQDGTLVRCDEGSWGEVAACRAGPVQAPISGGGDEPPLATGIPKKEMVTRARFERATPSFGGWCSIQAELPGRWTRTMDRVVGRIGLEPMTSAV